MSLSIRQRYVEGALRDAVQDLDKTAIRAPVVFVDYAVDDKEPYPVCVTIRDNHEQSQVRWWVGTH